MLRPVLFPALVVTLLASGPLGCGSDRPAQELSPETAANAPPPSEVHIVRPGEPTPDAAAPAAPAPPGPEAAPEPSAEPAAEEDPRTDAQRAADALVSTRLAEVEAAESTLAEARAALAKAQAAALRARSEPVDDADVFREVQRLLLEDPALAHVAIAAEVAAGVVILRGAVPDAATAEAAIELASRTAGVEAVRSELRLVD